MIPLQHKMEQLSKAYVSAVATMSDIINQFYDQDYGIDGTFRMNGSGERRFRATGYTIDYQLKSTMNLRINDGIIKYDYEVKNYDDFVYEESATPRILIVYYLPENQVDWLHVNRNFTLFQKCAWWTSGKDWEPTDNKNKITVNIPHNQIFDMEALKNLFERCRKGDPI